MKLQILSDIHLEFHEGKNGAVKFLHNIPVIGDHLIIAGDIATSTDIELMSELFSILTNKFKQVIVCLGNHDYYGKPKHKVENMYNTLSLHFGNFHYLSVLNGPYVIDGIKYLGCPLWFKYNDDAKMHRHHMNDFSKIPMFQDWLQNEEKACTSHLLENKDVADVIITHYLPSFTSVDPMYYGNKLNCFFVNDILDTNEFNCKLWIHGHTHSSSDYMKGDIRVVCNPYGYINYDTNKKFNPAKCVDI